MSKLAELIARFEGFYKTGSVPQRSNNPGDLRHSPHSEHAADPSAIGHIDTPEHGWADLEHQLELYASRNMSLRAAIYAFAPPTENDSERYLEFVCSGLQCTPDTPISEVLKA